MVFDIQVVPAWYKDFAERPHRPEVILSSPPRGHPVEYIHGIPPPQTHQHYPSDWEHSGPGLGSEYATYSQSLTRVSNLSSKKHIL